MFKMFSNFEWRKSRPHLFLLSRFQNPQEEFRQGFYLSHDSKDWADVLGEPLQKSIQRFLGENVLLKSNSAADCLSYRFGVSELKNMLKQRSLPISGNKDELISRLVENDPIGMKKITAGISVVRCSKAGQEIVKQFLSQEKERKTNVERQMAQALSEHRFRDAVQAFYKFEANNVFPRSLSLSNQGPIALQKWWEKRDPSDKVITLQLIFTKTPKILAKTSDFELDSARIAAGMFDFWESQTYLGSSKPSQIGQGYSPRDIALMLWGHAYYFRHLTDCKKSGIKFVGIDAGNDACDACKKIAKNKYKLDEVPELPYEQCKSPEGCKCDLLFVE